MASYIMAVIEWGIVPLILAGLLLFTLFGIPDDMADPNIKVSARSGKWAGLIVLVLFIISQKNRELTFSLKSQRMVSLSGLRFSQQPQASHYLGSSI